MKIFSGCRRNVALFRSFHGETVFSCEDHSQLRKKNPKTIFLNWWESDSEMCKTSHARPKPTSRLLPFRPLVCLENETPPQFSPPFPHTFQSEYYRLLHLTSPHFTHRLNCVASFDCKSPLEVSPYFSLQINLEVHGPATRSRARVRTMSDLRRGHLADVPQHKHQ